MVVDPALLPDVAPRAAADPTGGSSLGDGVVVGVAARVMVVEGRVGRRSAVLLGTEGLLVETTDADAERVRDLAAAFDPNVILLEVRDVSPAVVQLCSELQEATPVPIIVFCELREEAAVVAGFAAGAHSIVSEPVGPHELVARVRAMLRRSQPRSERSTDVLTVGPIVLDRSRRVLTVDGQGVPMPRREFEIAEYLMRNAGIVVSRADLLRELWGSTRDAKSLAVQVGRLRARLAAIEGFPRILTVRGVGYRFVDDRDLRRYADDSPDPAVH